MTRFRSMVFLLLSMGLGIAEDRLDEFESGFQEQESSSSPSVHASGEITTDAFDEALVEVMTLILLTGGAVSHEASQLRENGEPHLPLFRVDAGIQQVSDEIRGYDLGLQLGTAAFALDARWTRFREQNASRDLDLIQTHFLYRISGSRHFEIDLGLGAAWLRGEETRVGGSFSLPLRVWPWEHVGFELRPSWTGFEGVGLSDIESSILLKYEHIALQAGYRWIESEADVKGLSGPRAGICIYF